MFRIRFRGAAAIKLLGLALAALLLLWASDSLFKHQRIDLTEDRLFTLGEGTRSILAELQAPLELSFFYSETALREVPSLRNYALRVENLLQEMVVLADGKLRLAMLDPEPFSAQEDLAAELGIQAAPLEVGGAQLYLGLAVTGPSGHRQTIPFLHPERAQFLEYDLARAIYLASRSAPPTIGLISGLPVSGGLDLGTRMMHKPWAAVEQLKRLYALEPLGPDPAAIPDHIDLLLLIQPSRLGEPALRAIDQFVLGGGGALVFVDPYAESTEVPGVASTHRTEPSPLVPLLRAWGVELLPDQVVGDAAHALLVNIGDDRAPARNLTLLGLAGDHIAAGEAITDGLENINLSSAGAWRPLEGADTTWQPLLWSSSAAAMIDAQRVRTLRDPAVLFDGFVPDGRRYAMAGLLSGLAQSAFAGAGPAEGDHDPGLKQGSIKVFLAADTDLLSDRLWVQVSDFFGKPVLSPFADNGSLLVNAVDHLAGSTDLIAVRSRGVHERPFTRLHELRRRAEDRHRDELDQLNAQLVAAEEALAELRGSDAKTLVDADKQARIDSFVARKLALRKTVRELEHQLSAETEALGAKLKLMNIGLIPLCLTLALLLRLTLKWARDRGLALQADKAQTA